MPHPAAMKIQPPTDAPAALLLALQRARLHYTAAVDLYHCISVGLDVLCGVFGEGDNAAYEWFVWREGVLETSDVAYGSPEVALRDVLNQVVV
ncbi:MAG: hypothetical protein ACYDHN_07285 [Solirubrobacteraceae bacterium]